MSLKHFIPALSAIALLCGTSSAQKSDAPYWAYQPVQNVSVPEIKDPFVANPIDAFILAALREKGLSPNEQAPREQLIRRLSYDLTGLPPENLDGEWAALVDQLLASPRFGEKFASHWLDLVRYAETNGFERDSEKPEIWRYRDYVIKSFNEDKPYNRFLLEQLAGDQLPDKTFDSLVATGFMTLMQRDDEPADRPQAHADAIGDIVDVTGEAFLGVTFNCCKCHDHKGDPITQANYFSVMSFFDGIQQDVFKSANHTWIDPEFKAKREQDLQSTNTEIDTLWKSIDLAQLDPFLKKSPDAQPHTADWKSAYSIPRNPGWSLPSFDTSRFAAQGDWQHGKPLVLRGDFGLQEIPSQLLVYLQGQVDTLQVFINGTMVREGVPKKIGDQYLVFLPGNELTTGRNTIGLVATSNSHKDRKLEATLALKPLTDLSPAQLATISPVTLATTYGQPFAEKITTLLSRQTELARPVDGLRYMSVKDDAKVPAPAIHERGNFHAQGDPVPVNFPEILNPAQLPVPDFSDGKTEGRRLAFAQWVTDPGNPLAARVYVNRLWQYCFGHGLVETANDFGVFGTGVSNQALLDWLAAELVRSGWSTKHMLRLILNSSTYKLSSTGTHNVDPENKLHWRYNSRRLSAEEIWDTYLILTKRLKLEMGGPPVRPRMPRAILETSSTPDRVWPETKGDAANRRAVYIHAKRSIKLPLLAAFDSPERDISCPSRYATTVPTQALTMLNSEHMNELATAFATQLQGTLPEQISTAFELATRRPIQDSELQELTKLADDLRTTFQVPEDQLMPRLCLLILNLNETIHLD
ncbi:MAG: DUF1549 and DUF1553 domain-containing protein [Akkermansiaceae bacterium]|jgi:hypothetical protein